MIKKNTYKLFFLKLVVFILIVCLLDLSIGNMLEWLYFKKKNNILTTYAMEETNEDILIFGSSRANHHYIPDVFENCFDLSCFNTGYDGYFLFYNYAVLKGVLKRYKPEIVILDFNHLSFQFNQKHYDRLSVLLPYYKKHPEIHSIVELKHKYERIKLLSHIYPFNSMIVPILKNRRTVVEDKGYRPIEKTWKGSVPESDYSNKYAIDKNEIETYESFIKDCVNSNIKLYIVISPRLKISKTKDYSVELAKELAQKHGIKFFDYSKEFLNNPKLFADTSHLNSKGALLFSQMISEEIKKDAEQNKTNLSFQSQ